MIETQGVDFRGQVKDGWIGALIALGRQLVVAAAKRGAVLYRLALVVPRRRSASHWLALGGLLGALETAGSVQPSIGDRVWLFPRPNRHRFRPGKYLGIDCVAGGLHKVCLGVGDIEMVRREQVLFVNDTPTLERATSARRLAEFGYTLDVPLNVESCLDAEAAIALAGSISEIESIARSISFGDCDLADLLLLGLGRTFTLTRMVKDAGDISERVRLLVVDGPAKFAILEDWELSASKAPAVIVLSEEEWCQVHALDEQRVANAFENWGGRRCDDWPAGFPRPGLGAVIYSRSCAQ